MARKNLSTNPALGANATDWSGGTRVTVGGFQRPNAYQSTGSNMFHPVAQGIVAGEPLLVSFDHDLSIDFARLTIVWSEAGGAYIDVTDLTPQSAADSGGRFAAVVTPPANTGRLELQFKSFPSGEHVTAVLVEHRADVAPYFDGESELGTWDGARYNSTSTLLEEPPYDGPLKWVVEDFEDTTYEFTLSGWARASDSAAAGSWSMKSTNAGVDDSSDELLVTVPDDAQRVRFAYRVSSEEDWDWLRVFIDGIQQSEFSGESGWVAGTEYSVIGASTIGFRYVKDGNTNEGGDAAWIDNLEFEVPDLATGPEPGRFLIAYL